MKDIKPIWKTGFVILVDFLGVRSFDKPSTNDFLTKLNQVIDSCEIAKIAHRSSNSGISIKGVDLEKHFGEITFYVFGDTLLLCIEVANVDSSYKLEIGLLYTTTIICALSDVFIKLKMPFRGAISYGEYCLSELNVVLGPAVTDVAVWYEAAKWLGIILTPRLSIKCDNMPGIEMDDKTILPPHYWIIKTDIPTKTGIIKDLYVINWPKKVLIAERNPSDIFMTAFPVDEIPSSSSDIYANTVGFIKEVMNIKKDSDLF